MGKNRKSYDESYLYLMPEIAENVRKAAILEGDAQRIMAQARAVHKKTERKTLVTR